MYNNISHHREKTKRESRTRANAHIVVLLSIEPNNSNESFWYSKRLILGMQNKNKKSLDPLRAKKNIHKKERRWARLYSFG